MRRARALSEFDIIRRFFTREARSAVLGAGDDAALVRVSPGSELVVSTDMLVSGRHFFAGADPELLGYKAMAVNLSDMAAMGARPRWALLALAAPRADETWLRRFSRGFMRIARAHRVDLIGGDTNRGPLNICVQILGEVARGQALRRDGARAGDDIWVSGTLGDAALALAHLKKRIALNARERAFCLARLNRPSPRVELGLKLRGMAHSAIDISDGLLADLGHVLERSRVAADIQFESLPRSRALAGHITQKIARACLVAGGDDYELCFTASPGRRRAVLRLGTRLSLPLTRIGRIRLGKGLALFDAQGGKLRINGRGFDHFA